MHATHEALAVFGDDWLPRRAFRALKANALRAMKAVTLVSITDMTAFGSVVMPFAEKHGVEVAESHAIGALRGALRSRPVT
jgi:hypothetical protein